MAVLLVKEAAQAESEDREGGPGNRRRFFVRTDVLTDPALIKFAADPANPNVRIPRLGEAHPVEGGSRVRDVRVRQSPSDRKVFEVDVDYSFSSVPINPDPVLADPTEEWGVIELSETPPLAFNQESGGQQTIHIANSAGTPYIPGPERTKALQTLVIERNEWPVGLPLGHWSPSMARTYMGKLNASTFKGGAAHTVKCERISASRLRHPTGQPGTSTEWYYRVRYEFILNEAGWRASFHNFGSHYRNANDKLVPFVDEFKQPMDGWYLNTAGGSMAMPLPGGTVLVPRTFILYPSVDFGPLLLG